MTNVIAGIWHFYCYLGQSSQAVSTSSCMISVEIAQFFGGVMFFLYGQYSSTAVWDYYRIRLVEQM